MPKIGLSKPIVAKITPGGTTYTKRVTAGKYTEINIAPDESDENIFYADNAESESDSTFTGGNVTMSTDDLLPTMLVDMLGVTEESAGSSSTEKWYVFDDDQNAPYLALAGVVKRKNGGDTKYQAFVLEKIKFSNPALAVSTQGESIEWQTSELSARIFKSDKTKHPWYRLSSMVDSEADAVALIESYLTVTT